MANIEGFIDKARLVADAAGKKTGEIVEISKLKLQCVKLNNDINKLYAKLGESVYAMKGQGYENTAVIDNLCSNIKKLLKQLDDVSAKIADMKNIIICSACGEKNPNTSYYCSKCGSRIAEEFKNDYAEDDVQINMEDGE